MKGLLRSKLFVSLAAFIMAMATVVLPFSGSITHSFAATSRSSHNIAYVNYNDSGFTESGIPSANIFSNSVVSGPASTSSTTASVTYNGMTFTPLTRAALSSTTLAPFDTLILFEVCDIATSLTASQHTALNNYLAAGNKILLYDADRCAPIAVGSGAVGNADYSWFTFPFATSNPGPQGASGTLTVVENSTLTQGLSSDPFSNDELGDANTATTSDPHWFAAAKTTNKLGNNGFFLAYARNSGLIIYDGADRWFTQGPTKSLTDLFINELNQQYNPDNLPGTTPIAGSITLTKMATPTVAPGGVVTYALILTNTSPAGSVQLHNITLTDTPPSSTIVSISAPSTPVITPLGAALVDCSKATTHTLSCFVDNFAPGGTVTITFSATVKTTATGTITNTATAQSIDVGTVTAKASTAVTTAKHQTLFVLLQGIDSGLSKGDAADNGGYGEIPDFTDEVRVGPRGSIHIPGIVPFIQKNAFPNAKFLVFSYGGSNPFNGKPFTYDCLDTFTFHIDADALALSIQIAGYLKVQPKNTITDIYLVGHSLGGTVALAYLTALLKAPDKVISLPANGHLAGLITLDSPVGGVSSNKAFIDSIFNLVYKEKAGGLLGCSGLTDQNKQFNSVHDLANLFDTTSKPTFPLTDDGNPGSQGAHASILKAIFHGPALTNQGLVEMAAAKGIHVLTIGNTLDYVYNPSACPFGPSGIHPFINAQWVGDESPKDSAKEHNAPLPVYGRDFEVGAHICTLDTELFYAVNHKEVYHNSDVETALMQFLKGGVPDKLTIAPPEP